MSWLWRMRGIQVLGAPAGDLALAAVLAAFSVADTVLTGQFQWLDQWRGPRLVNGLVVPAAALLLGWRRRYPLTVLAGVCAATVGLGFAYGASQTSVNVFVTAVAIYSAAAYASSVPLAAGIAGAGIWLRDAHDPSITSFGDHLWDWLFAGLFFGVGLATRRRHERVVAAEQQARAAQRDQAERAEAAAEAERQRIARELHDIVAHSLGVLVFQAGVGEQLIAQGQDRDQDKAREAFRAIRTAGLEAVGEMGTILGLIRGDGVAGREPQPRAADIETLVRKARDTGVPVEFGVHGDPPPLPAAVELSMYRIAQEGLTNAMRHAPSAPIRVCISYREQSVLVEVINEAGQGAAPGTGWRGSGRGLIGLGERVAIFGGQLDAGPRPDGGWRLAATLPAAR
jgi:signal transduction histidine kinase